MNKVDNQVIASSQRVNIKDAGDNGMKKPCSNLMKITVAVAFAVLGIAGIATGYLSLGISVLALTLGLGYCLCKAGQFVFDQYKKYKAQQNASTEPKVPMKIEPKLPLQISEHSAAEIKLQRALEVVKTGTEEEIVTYIMKNPSLIDLQDLYKEDSEIFLHARTIEEQPILVELANRTDLDRTVLCKAKLLTICLNKPIEGREQKHQELSEKFIRQSGIDLILFQGKEPHQVANEAGNHKVGQWITDFYKSIKPINPPGLINKVSPLGYQSYSIPSPGQYRQVKETDNNQPASACRLLENSRKGYVQGISFDQVQVPGRRRWGMRSDV